MKILSFAIIILFQCNPFLSGAETGNENSARSIPPIFKAVMNGNAAEVIKYSKDGGDFDVRLKSYDNSPLIVLAPDVTMTSLLIHLGADPKSKSDSNVTALMSAGRNGYLAQARLLVKEGLSIHAADKDGRHVIHFAIGNMNTIYLRWLLEEGANANAKTAEGVTPLMEAMWYPDYEEIKMLVLHGADPRIKDGKGKDAFDYLEDRKEFQDDAIHNMAFKLIQEAKDRKAAAPEDQAE